MGRVDDSGTIRWVEVCYCREYYGVAMHEELPYLEEYLTDIEVADARSPRYCKGYPECNDCDCTRKVRFHGEPLMDHLLRGPVGDDSRRRRTSPDPMDGLARSDEPGRRGTESCRVGGERAPGRIG